MRFSNVLISLALLLSIGSITAQSLIQGTWSNAYTSQNSNYYCCIPSSVTVSCTGNYSCSASYIFPNNMNSKCYSLFRSSTSGRLALYNSYSESYYSETTFWGSQVFNFRASNATGSPRLNIASQASGCDFTFYSRQEPVSGGAGGIVIFVIVFFIIVCCAGGAKQYRKNRTPIIIAQNLTQQPTVVTTYDYQPTPVVVQQGFVQTQPTYIAPQQFPNTQVNMNYNQFPNTQVNMNYTGNGYN